MSLRSIVGSQALRLGDESVLLLNTLPGTPFAIVDLPMTFRRLGKVVIANVDTSANAVSTAAAVFGFVESVPLEYRPLITQFIPIAIIDNSVAATGLLQITASGLITFGAGIGGAAFTGANNAQFFAKGFSYPVQ